MLKGDGGMKSNSVRRTRTEAIDLRKLCSVLLLVLITLSILSNLSPIIVKSQDFLSTDALIPRDLDLKQLAGFSDPSPGYFETSEYLIGSVAVGIILLESDGGTENWDSDREQEVVLRIDDGLDVLASYNPFSFTFDVHYRVPTSYEPINGPHMNHDLWVSEAMANLDPRYATGDHIARVRKYINDLRNSTGTDWAFAIFVVDSENDPDGCFTDWNPEANWGWYAFVPFVGAPYFVMTYDVGNIRGSTGTTEMDRVTAHETCHIFYATDEYNGMTEYSGYLNGSDIEGSGKLMDWMMNWSPSDGTKGQIGWRPFAGLEDSINTFPDTYLVPYSPDPTTDPTPTYTGSVVDVPYPNNNPYGTSRDVTINTITKVQFRVDEGAWIDATPVDGTFDDALEDFTFTTLPLTEGTHIIETRGINSVGNTETTYASDVITVDLNDPPTAPTVDVTPNFPYTNDDLVATVTSPSTDPDGDTVTYTYEWYRNEVLQPAETTVTTGLSDTLLSILTAKSEIWKCVVTPNDGTVNGTPDADQVVIQNTPPEAFDLGITPDTPYITDDLVATYSYTDADGDTESGSEIRWYKDGILQQEYNGQLAVPALATVEGDMWHFTVRPKDGTDFGDLATSSNVTVIVLVETTIQIGDKNYTITTESNATIADVTATRNTLHFTSSGPTGETAYINTTLPVGLNKTEIKVFVDGVKLTPPPFPIITTNGTHYFVYFEFTLSAHNITIQFAPALLGDINDDGTVNILDAIILAGSFGSEPDDQNWNPNADINGDAVVNILDAIILASHFGETV